MSRARSGSPGRRRAGSRRRTSSRSRACANQLQEVPQVQRGPVAGQRPDAAAVPVPHPGHRLRGRDWSTIGEIAEKLQAKHHGVVALVDRCEKLDLVERRRVRRTAGQVEIHLRPKGLEIARPARRLHPLGAAPAREEYRAGALARRRRRPAAQAGLRLAQARHGRGAGEAPAAVSASSSCRCAAVGARTGALTSIVSRLPPAFDDPASPAPSRLPSSAASVHQHHVSSRRASVPPRGRREGRAPSRRASASRCSRSVISWISTHAATGEAASNEPRVLRRLQLHEGAGGHLALHGAADPRIGDSDCARRAGRRAGRRREGVAKPGHGRASLEERAPDVDARGGPAKDSEPQREMPAPERLGLEGCFGKLRAFVSRGNRCSTSTPCGAWSKTVPPKRTS